MSEIVFSGSYRPLSENDIRHFETGLGSRLPQRYRQFLLRTNGGHPHRHMLPYCYVQGFNGIKSDGPGSLVDDIRIMADELPEGMIPIAYAGNGHRLCLSLVDDNIYLWEHGRDYGHQRARLVQLTLLANDIDELLNKLEGDDTPIPDDEISNLGRWGDIDLLDSYLNRGHDINTVTEDGRTLAQCAVYGGHLQFLKGCARRGSAFHGRGLLHAAMFKMNVEILEYLLDQGLDPNEKDDRGMTPLDCAPPPCNGPAAQLLKNKGGIKTSKSLS